jgi:hypothetical protein
MKRITFSRTVASLAALGLAMLVGSTAQAAGGASAAGATAGAGGGAAAASPQPAIGVSPIQMAPSAGGNAIGSPTIGGYGAGGMGTRFGNAEAGTPLGNLQLQTGGNPTYGPSGVNNGGNGSYGSMYNGSLNGPTIGGVNGAGNVVGGFQSGGVQHFQNGAIEVGGFQRGAGVGGNYPMPTVYGTQLPSYGQVPGLNQAIYGSNTPSINLQPNYYNAQPNGYTTYTSGYNPGNYNTTAYGFTPSPQPVGVMQNGYQNVTPPNFTPMAPETTSPAAVQYGWW